MGTKVLATFVVILCTFSLPVNGAIDPVFQALLDDYITNTFMPAIDVPGLGLSLVLDGEIALAKGYGWSDEAKGIKINESSLFGVGSVSKTILSTITLKILYDKFPQYGKEVLDVPIKVLAPSWNMSYTDRYRSESMSFRDLLAHVHCVCNSQLNLLVGASATSNEFTYRCRYEGQCCRYRSLTQSYSNTQYAVAGEALAAVAKEPLEIVVERTMRQMGMPYSLYYKLNGSHEAANLAQGYYWLDGANHKFNMTIMRKMGIAQGGGGVAGSSADLAAYIKFHVNGGIFNGTQVIPAEVLKWQYESSLPYVFNGYKNSEDGAMNGAYAYGLGIAPSVYDGWKFLQHVGFIGPYSNKISFMPDMKVGIFSTCNQGTRTEKGHDELHFTIFEAYRLFVAGEVNPFEKAQKKVKVHQSFKDFNEMEKNSWLPQTPKEKYTWTKTNPTINEWFNHTELVGIFGNRLDGEIKFTLGKENGTLNIEYGIWGIGILHPITDKDGWENLWSVEWTTDIQHQFYAVGWGDIVNTFHFQSRDTVVSILNDGAVSSYQRGALLALEPLNPYTEDSCSAD